MRTPIEGDLRPSRRFFMLQRIQSWFDLSPAWRWLIWGVFVAAWTYALLAPIPDLPEDTLIAEHHFVIGKSIHVAVYTFWTLLSAWLRAPARSRWLLLAFISFHAMATEYLQQFVERGSSLRDVGLDHIGLLLGVALSWKWWKT